MPARGPCHGQLGRDSPSPLGPCVYAAGGPATHLAAGRAPAALAGVVGGVEVGGERAQPGELRQLLVGGGIWWWSPGPRHGSTASDRGRCGGRSGIGTSGCMCGMVRLSGSRECCAAALCPAMSSQPRRSAYRAPDCVTQDTVRSAAAAAPPPACDAERAVAAVLAAGVPPLPPLQPYQRPRQQPERMHVHLAQVPPGQGWSVTWSR